MAVPVGRYKKATQTSTLKVGDEAPDFALPTHLGERAGASSKDVLKLSDLRGKKSAVLVFFPLAFTPV